MCGIGVMGKVKKKIRNDGTEFIFACAGVSD